MDWSCGKATVHMRTSLTHLDTFWNISTHLDATRLLPFCFGPALNIVTGRLTYLHFLLGYIGVIDNYVMCVIVCVLCVVCRYVIICIQLVAWLQVSGLTKSLLLNCGEPPLCKASARLTSKVRLIWWTAVGVVLVFLKRTTSSKAWTHVARCRTWVKS